MLAVLVAMVLGIGVHTMSATASDASGGLSLPWASGASWLFNGPHTWGGDGLGPWDSLDLEGGDRGHDQVLAATDGTAHLDGKAAACGYVRVDALNGWQTTYIHMTQALVSEGQPIHRGDLLGITDKNVSCFGSANAYHVHFSIWFVPSGHSFCFGCTQYGVDWQGLHGGQGSWQEQIGNYLWTDGAQEYQGCAKHVITGIQTCWSNYLAQSISNDGAIAGGARNPGQPGGPADSWDQNRLDVFVRGLDYGFWQLTGNGASIGWGSWVSHLYPSGTDFESQPVAVSWSTNRIDLFGIGLDGFLYHQWSDGTSWYPGSQSWQLLGSGNPTYKLTGTPAVNSWGPNRLDIIATDTTGQVWHECWNGSSWCSWEAIGTDAISDPVVGSWGLNRLDVFELGFSGGVLQYLHQFWSSSGGWGPSQTTWEQHGNPSGTSFTSRPSMVAWSSNRLDIVGTAADHTLYHQSWNGSNWSPGGLSGWEKVGGGNPSGTSFTGTPAVVTWSASRFDLFILDSNNAGWHMAYNGTWGQWENHAAVFTADLSAVSWGNNRLDVFGRGQDTGIYWQYWAGGPTWLPSPAPTTWIPLGGQTT